MRRVAVLAPTRSARGRARTVVALALALPWLVWLAFRGLGLDRDHPFVALMSLTPYVAATSPLPVLVALLLRRRAVAAVALLPVLGLAALVVPRALGDGDRSAGGSPFVVLSANLYDGNADPRALLAMARREDVDVLNLHEATTAALEDLDDAGLRKAFPTRFVDDGQSAVLVRRGLQARRVGPDTPATARVRLPGGAAVDVAAPHPVPPISRASVRSWRRDLQALPSAGTGPLRVLAGDFNATLDHRELRRVLARGYDDAADLTGAGLGPTWPVERRRPPVAIDHVLLDERLGVTRFARLDLPGSDHRAVVAELRLP